MPCVHVDLGNGVTAIVKVAPQPRKRCWVCGCLCNARLCDFILTEGKRAGKSCDKPLCSDCAVHCDPDVDYCPTHDLRLTR